MPAASDFGCLTVWELSGKEVTESQVPAQDYVATNIFKFDDPDAVVLRFSHVDKAFIDEPGLGQCLLMQLKGGEQKRGGNFGLNLVRECWFGIAVLLCGPLQLE